MKYNKFIDHTLLKQDSNRSQIDKLISEAIKYDFMSVCVNPYWISYCKEALNKTDVKICTVIGFPLGANTIESKVFEAKDAISKGADEIDMVINVGALKDQNYDYLVKEISEIKKACNDKILKVIIETCLLTDEEKIMACKAIIEAKADFVKTSTGFSISGATFSDVKLLKDTVKDNCLIKAAGGVKTHEDLVMMINLGADRIGTSSGVKLMEKENSETSY